MANQSRQPDGAEIDQGNAKAAAEDAESGVFRDHPHVRPQCEFHAAGDSKSFDRGDHGFRQPQPARPHRRDRIMAADLALFVGIARRHRLEVGAGTEIAAGAGEHRHRGFLVGIEGAKDIVQFSRGGAVDGVAAMRTVDGNDGHRSIAFDEHGIGLDHGFLPDSFVGCLPIARSPNG
jgi:hypothetical protein